MDAQERLHRSPARRFMQFLGLLMFAFYFIMGLAIIFWKDEDFPLQMNKTYRILFALLLIGYSFFRFVRLMRVRKDEK